MDTALPLQIVGKSRTLLVTWLLSFVLAFTAILSLWVLPRLRPRVWRYLGLAEAGTTGWILLFIVGSIGCVVLLVGMLLAFQNRKVTARSRIWTALAVLCTVSLWGYWFYATTANSFAAATAAPSGHSVKITWKASTSPVAGYNVYRSTTADHFKEPRLNSELITGASYVDATVESNKTYYYVAKAVDVHGNESDVSNVAKAKIP